MVKNDNMRVDDSEQRPLSQVKEKIDRLDLGCIKVKLTSKKDGAGWSVEKADEAEVWYKRFLYLNFKYRDVSVVVNKNIDMFWHYHILDTLKYHEDCKNIFGFFLHHFPYFGMRGEEDEAKLNEAYQNTLEIFEKEFGTLGTGIFGPSTCADVCTSPCDSPAKLTSLERPVWQVT